MEIVVLASDRIELEQADDADQQPAPVAVVSLSPRKIDELQLHSEHVQEVLGAIPHWLVRWGITAVFLILALLLAVSWIIRYPDVVPASIVITTVNPPSGVVAQTDGYLIDVRVRENEHVQRGALLAVVQNSAEPDAVFLLKKYLDASGSEPDHYPTDVGIAENLSLGELQGGYSTFVKNYKAFRYYVEVDPAGQEIRSLEPQLVHYRDRLDNYLLRRDILLQEVGLAERDFRRARDLTARQVLSTKDSDEKERQLLQTRRALKGAELDITNTRIDLDKLEQNLTQLRLRDRQQKHDLQLALAESYKNLRSQLAVWERNYVLRAPVDGQVSLFKFWSEHQFVKAGDEVLTMVSEGDQRIIGKLTMPLVSSGKVEPGQDVYIRLDNYPYQEYGLLRGQVRSMSLIPRDDHYAIEVALPQALRTSFGRQLDFRQEMQGRAEIVTEDLRLLERIFYQLRKLMMGDGGSQRYTGRTSW
jgi:multidrug resistance efflux pump